MLVRFQSSTARVLLAVGLLLLGGCARCLWAHEAALSAPWTPDEASRRFAGRPLPPPDERALLANYTLPLRTRGRHIVDAAGRRFKLAAVHWYGASDELFVPGGLDVQHRDAIAATVRALGFNAVRMPYSDEMVVRNPAVPAARVAANPDLAGRPALDVFVAAVTALTDAGLAVVVNNHITSASSCCGADPCDAGWANDHLPAALCRVRQSEDDWIAHWEAVMARFVANPGVVAADLRHEVRGLWGGGGGGGTRVWDRWAAAAERCGDRLLQLRPDWLVVVGGTAAGSDLAAAARRPVRLARDHRLVYAAHVYSWSGWGSRAGRFSQRPYASFAAALRRSWAYLVDADAAPVWVGAFGAPREPSVGDAHYWHNLVRFLRARDLDYAYCALNPRKPAANNASETYGLLRDDWRTPVLDYRLHDLVRLRQPATAPPTEGEEL